MTTEPQWEPPGLVFKKWPDLPGRWSFGSSLTLTGLPEGLQKPTKDSVFFSFSLQGGHLTLFSVCPAIQKWFHSPGFPPLSQHAGTKFLSPPESVWVANTNYDRWGGFNSTHLFLIVLEAGSSRSRYQQIQQEDLLPNWQMAAFLSPHWAESRGRKQALLSHLISTWTPSRRFHPHDRITSQRPHLLEPSHWWLAFQYMNSDR